MRTTVSAIRVRSSLDGSSTDSVIIFLAADHAVAAAFWTSARAINRALTASALAMVRSSCCRSSANSYSSLFTD
ncbi:Uncharacterised protein [Mycobacteroides abscessus subsp. abscessus]|nr:Uncharacterised protein [Mycobacteroides abscessus subsp. abscessus]